jgi:hypothetical protein
MVNVRPRDGSTPNMEKKFPLTISAAASCGYLP